MLLYLRMAHDARPRAGRLETESDLDDAIMEGAAKRIRPQGDERDDRDDDAGRAPAVLWSSGTGSDVMRRIAAPMVVGLVSSFVLELTIYPALYALWKRRALRAAGTPLPVGRSS
jgi:copper/silver efflux system protein